MHLSILKIERKYQQSNPNYEPTLPELEDVEFLKKTFRKEPMFKVVKFYSRVDRELTILTYTELVKCAVDEKMYLRWKFIGIDDEEFSWLYAPSCDYVNADVLNR